MSENVVLVISLQSWQYWHRQLVVKFAVLMLYLNSLYLLTHSRRYVRQMCDNFQHANPLRLVAVSREKAGIPVSHLKKVIL
jgi:hypothetical protein